MHEHTLSSVQASSEPSATAESSLSTPVVLPVGTWSKIGGGELPAELERSDDALRKRPSPDERPENGVRPDGDPAESGGCWRSRLSCSG